METRHCGVLFSIYFKTEAKVIHDQIVEFVMLYELGGNPFHRQPFFAVATFHEIPNRMTVGHIGFNEDVQ